MINVLIKNRTIHIFGIKSKLNHIIRLTPALEFIRRPDKFKTRVGERITIKTIIPGVYPIHFLDYIKPEYEDYTDLSNDLMDVLETIKENKND